MTPHFGRFQIRRELHRGAQSIIHLAWDPRLQRDVAIKTLRDYADDPASRRSLLSEARMMGKLRHRNVIPIFEAGEFDGQPFLVFELVKGRSLREALAAEGRFDAVKAARIMCGILDALAEAHRLDIVHRDIKPTNILIDSSGEPLLMDFGIARQVPGPFISDEGKSGTPAYMAPEYMDGGIVGIAGDVYAAGVTLLEMLTGTRAVAGNSFPQISRSMHLHEIEMPAAIDPRLQTIIGRACAREPARRYVDAGQMRQGLVVFLTQAREESRKPWHKLRRQALSLVAA